MLDLRFQPRDLLAIPGIAPFAVAERFAGGGQVGFDLERAGFVAFELRRVRGCLFLEFRKLRIDGVELLR
jgi:hypothetical protein